MSANRACAEGVFFEAPLLRHIGIFTWNVEKTAAFLSTLLPCMEPWIHVERVYEEKDVIVGTPCRMLQALSRCGEVPYELVQPVDSPDSYQARVLRENGEGFQHIAYVYPNHFDAVLARMHAHGYETVWAGQRQGGPRVHYLGIPDTGIAVEILDRALPHPLR